MGLQRIVDGLSSIEDDIEKIQKLAQDVASFLGGASRKTIVQDMTKNVTSQRKRSKSNVIPLTKLRYGTERHRALLFKFCADLAGLPTKLVRGKFNPDEEVMGVWNVVRLRPKGFKEGGEKDDLVIMTGVGSSKDSQTSECSSSMTNEDSESETESDDSDDEDLVDSWRSTDSALDRVCDHDYIEVEKQVCADFYVDLMFTPGQLYKLDSTKAEEYHCCQGALEKWNEVCAEEEAKVSGRGWERGREREGEDANHVNHKCHTVYKFTGNQSVGKRNIERIDNDHSCGSGCTDIAKPIWI
eukprot:TRINITY_DN2362_c1_g1_i4.p1 TRINITY_DN2362_c1_g1~~TRINITY_DN2362_c1_g1_i4.p1  ORF type:complete len:299 (+),score=64.95 TRINITY_DN2362_c1_g1_i4:485-1381(+)